MNKFMDAAVAYGAETCEELTSIAESLDLFEYLPETHSANDYGKYLIQNCGEYEFCGNLYKELEKRFDFESYGRSALEQENGVLMPLGYICWRGETPMDELLGRTLKNELEITGIG